MPSMTPDVAARTCASLVLAAALATAAAAAEPVPPPPKAHFNDYASLVRPEAGARLDAKLRDFETETGHQVVVAIFPALPAASLEDFTARTAQAWRVGRKGLDDGVVLFVFVGDRKLRLEVGYGLEDKIPDAVAKRILDDVIAPRFRAGDVAAGLDAGIDAVVAASRGQRVPGALAAPASAAPPGPREIVLSVDDLQRVFSLLWCLVAVILAARERELLAEGAVHRGRLAAVVLGGILFTIVGLVFAFQGLTRIAALTAGLSTLDLTGPAFVRKLAGTKNVVSGQPSTTPARIAGAWLTALGLVLCAWGVLPRGEWKGWSLGSLATFLTLQGLAALGAWRGRRYWSLRLVCLGSMVAIAVAFFFSEAYLFGFMPALALPFAFPVAWMMVAMMVTPVLALFRLKPYEWWFPKGEGGSGSSHSWSSGGGSSGSSSGGFSGGGGSFGGGGASGSW